MAPWFQTMTRPVLQAPRTTTTPAMTPYAVKLPTACTSIKSITASMTNCAKNTTGTPRLVRFELPLVTFEPRKLCMVTRETTKTVTERVERLINEPCSMQACKKENGRHARTLVTIITAAFDEYEGEFFDNKHPMCPGCADKIKRSFMGESVMTLGHNTSHGLSRCVIFFSFFLFHLITSSIRGWHSHRHVFALFPSSLSIPSVMVSLL